MHPSLQIKFDQIEVSRAELQTLASGFLPDQFLRSKNDSWSAGQILTHLLTSEQMSLGYMKKKSLGIDNLSNSGISEAIKIQVLKISQRLPIKYKVPEILSEKTPPAFPINELITNWNAARQDLKDFLEKISDNNIRKKIYKHPVAGMLNIAQALQFFDEHIHHHKPQIKKLIREMRK
jgi:hypothetical protein